MSAVVFSGTRGARALRVFSFRGALALAVPVALLASGCGNYTATTRQAREEFYAGKFTEAAKQLEAGAREEGVDQLLFVLDRATALHHAADFDESIKEFHLADKIAEIKDYTSLSAEAATLLSNDKIIPYKGEDFEKVLISQYLALNYLMQKKYEDALVECRRVNHKLHLMITQGKRKYKLSPMASYLAALMYESRGEWNDAYVDYQAVSRLLPEFEPLREDLYRLAWRNRISDHARSWAERFGLSIEDQRRIREHADDPEIVVVLEIGKSPEKMPNPIWQALPKYVPRYNPVAGAEVLLNGESRGHSAELFNVERTAIENLDEKFGGLIAKRIGGVVAKEVVADQVGRRTDPIVGALVRLGLHAVDQADLRSWLTLPKTFHIFRAKVPLSTDHVTVKVVPHDSAGGAIGSPLEKVVTLTPGRSRQWAFVPVRVL